jgi:hypothetical protein
MNKKALILSGAVLSILALAFVNVYAQTKSCSYSGNKIYDGRIVQVKGKVTFLNHPELGKTPANGMYLVFQRDDCKNCLVATHADIDGNYEIFVGEGRYKVIVYDFRCDDFGGTGCDCYNLLAPKQAQYFDAKRGSFATEFNIDLVLPKR